MKNKTHFNPQSFSKELKNKFKHLLIGDVFEKEGKRFQYVGKDDNGNIAAVLLDAASTSHQHHVGSQIKKIRILREMTQSQLAEKANKRVATISEIEAGKSNCEINTLVELAVALNCYLDITLTPIK